MYHANTVSKYRLNYPVDLKKDELNLYLKFPYRVLFL